MRDDCLNLHRLFDTCYQSTRVVDITLCEESETRCKPQGRQGELRRIRMLQLVLTVVVDGRMRCGYIVVKACQGNLE